jgi:hypothetical protein
MDFKDLSWKSEAWSWKFVRPSVRPCVRTYVYPPLTNLYFRLALKPFSVWKVTMGAVHVYTVHVYTCTMVLELAQWQRHSP